MKLAVVYNPLDNKLRPDTYSYIYKGMLDAVIDRFKPQHVTRDCSAKQIYADVILFFDVNSCHHIEIKGIEKHPALKLEYMSDPHQIEMVGLYKRYNMPVHKLGARQRVYRMLDRGIDYIVSSNKTGYFQFLAPILGEEKAEEMLWFFPHAPWFKCIKISLLARRHQVLANGAVASNKSDGYAFRKWAFQRPNLSYVPHFLNDNKTAMGRDYGEFLQNWAGALALSETFPVPKYYEMPIAGCVTFMQYHSEVEELGFKDFVNCIYVNKKNFDERIKDFLSGVETYQSIADRGRELMEENYTAEHFARFLEEKIRKEI